MLSEAKERLEGPKHNIDFGGEGVGVDRGREWGMSTMQKGAIFMEVSRLLSLIVEC